MRSRWLALWPLLWGCVGLHDGVFQKAEVRYAVATPDQRQWRAVHLGGNDLAWVARDSGELIAMNATCEDHGDPPLEVLTQHLLIGFADHQLVAQAAEPIDGREALRSKYHAKLDGVPVELELVVLKKNGCVHDFTFVAPLGAAGAHRAEFDALVSGFRQEVAP
jgi:hypothetical protein